MDTDAAARAIDAFLLALGRDPRQEPELRGTGARVARAFAEELCAGYAVDVPALLHTNRIASADRSVVVLRDAPVATTCPHHLMASTGRATVAFAPAGHLLGAGALVELVQAFARRLALQETIGEGVVQALADHLGVRWAACRLEMTHTCMTARGERAHGARLVTYAARGVASGSDEGLAFVRDGA